MKAIFSVLIVLLIVSCSKEGVGGSGVISGTVKRNIISKNGEFIESIPAINKSVFITYGDENYYNNDLKTDINGYFEFEYLNKGDYKLFVYSDCIDCTSGKKEVSKSTTLKKGGHNEVEIEIDKIVDYDDGSSVISGVLIEQEFVGVFPVGDPYVSQENEIYITYGTDEVYFDRMDTGFDGKYEFKDLVKGVYTLYAYSTCGSCVNVNDTVSFQIEITDNNSSLVGDTLILEKR